LTNKQNKPLDLKDENSLFGSKERTEAKAKQPDLLEPTPSKKVAESEPESNRPMRNAEAATVEKMASNGVKVAKAELKARQSDKPSAKTVEAEQDYLDAQMKDREATPPVEPKHDATQTEWDNYEKEYDNFYGEDKHFEASSGKSISQQREERKGEREAGEAALLKLLPISYRRTATDLLEKAEIARKGGYVDGGEGTALKAGDMSAYNAFFRNANSEQEKAMYLYEKIEKKRLMTQERDTSYPEIAFSRKKVKVESRPVSNTQNIVRGKNAMSKVIKEHSDVFNAMYREDVGEISFYWGKEGKADKGFKGGSGVAKIIAKRESEGANGVEVAEKMVGVIAKGKSSEPYGVKGGERVNINYEGHTAVLSLYKSGNKETWLLTGWHDLPSGGKEGVNPNDTYAQRPSGIQDGVGAEAKARNKPSNTPSIDHNNTGKQDENRGDLLSTLTDKELDAIIKRVSERLSVKVGVAGNKVRHEVIIVDTFFSLPAAISKQADNENHDGSDVGGVFHKGKVYVVRDNLAMYSDVEARVETVLLHEFVHADVRAMFGTKFTQKLNQLYLAIGGNQGLKAIAKARGIDLSEYGKAVVKGNYPIDVRHRIMMDELLAHIGQVKPNLKGKIKEIIGAIRQWLRSKKLLKLAGYGETDLLHVIATARKQAK
ncbi:MAG: hypothetical protein R8M45_02800, partial [Ghiorsea sp.]